MKFLINVQQWEDWVAKFSGVKPGDLVSFHPGHSAYVLETPREVAFPVLKFSLLGAKGMKEDWLLRPAPSGWMLIPFIGWHWPKSYNMDPVEMVVVVPVCGETWHVSLESPKWKTQTK